MLFKKFHYSLERTNNNDKLHLIESQSSQLVFHRFVENENIQFFYILLHPWKIVSVVSYVFRRDEEVSRHRIESWWWCWWWFDRLKATRKTKNIYSHWKFIQFFNLLLHSLPLSWDNNINLTAVGSEEWLFMTLIDNDRFSNWENLISVPFFPLLLEMKFVCKNLKMRESSSYYK